MLVDRPLDPRRRAQQLRVLKLRADELDADREILRTGKSRQRDCGDMQHGPEALKQQVARPREPLGRFACGRRRQQNIIRADNGREFALPRAWQARMRLYNRQNGVAKPRSSRPTSLGLSLSA